MRPETALVFILLGAQLAFFAPHDQAVRVRRLVLPVIAICISLAALVPYVLWRFGTGGLIPSASESNHMSPVTATAFVLLGSAWLIQYLGEGSVSLALER
jgi:hypothetical protein